MSLKEIKQRIISVGNTKKITSAMKLVSAAKLRRAQSKIESMYPFEHKLDDILQSFLAEQDSKSTHYTIVREIKNVAIISLTSNSSLCGAFNSNIIRLSKSVIDEYCKENSTKISLYPVGRKIADALRKMNLQYNSVLMEQAEKPRYQSVFQIAGELMEKFRNGELDKIELIYNHFHSTSTQIVTQETLLPIDINRFSKQQTHHTIKYIVEPSIDDVLSKLIPTVVSLRLYTAMLDSIAAEHAARMIAMQTATDNAEDLATTLTREYNKMRQQAITNELLDIASGSTT